MSRKRPGVGQARKTRQPLKIDKLPVEWREQIQKWRAVGKTWAEIEELSKGFPWREAPAAACEGFADGRIPESNLIRWHDLRVEQVQKETLARSEQARALAATFAKAGLDNTDEAVVNALRDNIFILAESSAAKDRAQLIDGLTKLGLLLTEIKKNDIRERKVKVDEIAAELAKRKTDAALKKFEEASAQAKRKLEKGQSITLDDLNRLRERVFGLDPLKPTSRATANG